jgi:hypothetical protein
MAPPLLISVLDGYKWFHTPEKGATDTLWIGVGVGHRAGLDTGRRRKMLYYQE